MIKKKNDYYIERSNVDLDRKERITRIKETVDIVFIRVILLSILVVFAQQSIVSLFRHGEEYQAAQNRERLEEQQRIDAAKLLIEEQNEAKRKEIEGFNNYYNREYQKQKSLAAPVDVAPITKPMDDN